MKRIYIFSVFILFFGLYLSAKEVKIMTDVQIGYPLDIGKSQLDYFSLNPIYDLSVDIAIDNNFGIASTIDWISGKFKDNLFDKKNFGNYNFFSYLVGLFYSINFDNGIIITPDIQLGCSYSELHIDPEYEHHEVYFSFIVSTAIEKMIDDNIFVFLNSSFGYYNIYCPISLGIGVGYTFN